MKKFSNINKHEREKPTNADEDVLEGEIMFTVAGSTKQVSHYEHQCISS